MKLNRERRSAFTLIELLASMAILGLIMVMLFAAVDQITKAWTQGEARVETFTQARAALDYMAKELAQAIVTSNITFVGNANNLAFVAPVNDTAGAVDLMEVVYRPSWLRQGTAVPDDPAPHVFVDPISTWPAKLVRRTSHFDAVPGALPGGDGWNYGFGTATLVNKPWDFYPLTIIGPPNPDWPETSAYARTAALAENVMRLVFDYYDANGNLMNPAYWNSNRALLVSWSHELPPATAIPAGIAAMINRAPSGVQIAISVIDSKAAIKLSTLTAGSAAWMAITNQATRMFTTYVAIPNGKP